MLTPEERRAKIGAAIRVASGNFLEMYDFIVFIVTFCVGVSNFFWLPIGGWLSDRVGRRPILLVIPILVILSGYPAMRAGLRICERCRLRQRNPPATP
jgi:MFS family permease